MASLDINTEVDRFQFVPKLLEGELGFIISLGSAFEILAPVNAKLFL